MVQIDVGGDKGFFGSADTAVLAVIASDIFVFGSFFNFYGFAHFFWSRDKDKNWRFQLFDTLIRVFWEGQDCAVRSCVVKLLM